MPRALVPHGAPTAAKRPLPPPLLAVPWLSNSLSVPLSLSGPLEENAGRVVDMAEDGCDWLGALRGQMCRPAKPGVDLLEQEK